LQRGCKTAEKKGRKEGKGDAEHKIKGDGRGVPAEDELPPLKSLVAGVSSKESNRMAFVGQKTKLKNGH